MERVTRIAESDVPIDEGPPSVVHFSEAGSREIESGPWEFWTLYDGSRAVTGRCRQGSDPGERFRRMEGQEEYEDAWEIAAAAKGIRPATHKAVTGWLNSHRKDAQFAESCRIGSQTMKVVHIADGFQLE